jgi:hypothetical protein
MRASVKSAAGDQHEAGDAAARTGALHEFAREQQRDPAAHGGADQNLRANGEGLEHGARFLEPARHGAVLEAAAGFAVTGIVEAHDGAAGFLRVRGECLGLGASHVGLEAAKPHEAGRGALTHATATGRAAPPVPTLNRCNISSLMVLP